MEIQNAVRSEQESMSEKGEITAMAEGIKFRTLATGYVTELIPQSAHGSTKVSHKQPDVKVKEPEEPVKELKGPVKPVIESKGPVKLAKEPVKPVKEPEEPVKKPVKEPVKEPEEGVKTVTEEYEVEKILTNQETHDLICPDCKSCITGRVVLKRRKRNSVTDPIGLKRRKHEKNDWVTKVAYKCLSCLKYFIPKDSADSMTRFLDSETQKGTLTTRFKNIFYMLSGSASVVVLVVLSLLGSASFASVSAVFVVFIIVSCLFYFFTSTVREKVWFFFREKGKDGEKTKKPHQPQEITPRTIKDPADVVSNYASSVQVRDAFGSPEDNKKTKEPQELQEITQKPKKESPSSLSEIEQPERNEPKQVGNKPENVKDVIIVGDSPVQELIREILKSIVYGGLSQCITSLNAVSSAASSGATTVNIFVLGLTNLIGGLTLLLSNLKEMRNQTNEGEEDRYKELFGKKENSKLHTSLATASFAIFGLIPPVVFTLAFQETDNKDHKMLSVSAVSAFCIALLAVAKAFVEKKPLKLYVKCVASNLSLGFASSTVTYFAGDYVRGLVEKYQSNGLPNLSGLSESFDELLPAVVDEMDWYGM